MSIVTLYICVISPSGDLNCGLGSGSNRKCATGIIELNSEMPGSIRTTY